MSGGKVSASVVWKHERQGQNINENPLVNHLNNCASSRKVYSCSQHSVAVAPTPLPEEQKIYTHFVSLIKNKRVNDAILFEAFCTYHFRGGNLDTLHPPDQASLAVVLMQVTLPHDAQKNAAKRSDKNTNCFRYLGHNLLPHSRDKKQSDNPSMFLFKGSVMEQQFQNKMKILLGNDAQKTFCTIL